MSIDDAATCRPSITCARLRIHRFFGSMTASGSSTRCAGSWCPRPSPHSPPSCLRSTRGARRCSRADVSQSCPSAMHCSAKRYAACGIPLIMPGRRLCRIHQTRNSSRETISGSNRQSELNRGRGRSAPTDRDADSTIPRH
jgi:hypothetical protein